jgi:hypothetical protein
MWKKLLQLTIGSLCGYLYIKWIPVMHPFHLADFLLELVLNPDGFFASSVSFIIGFLLTGELIRETFFMAFRNFRKKNLEPESVTGLGVILSMVVLIDAGLVQSAVFFSISFIYGMISLK